MNRDAFRSLNIVSDIDVAVATVEADAAARDQLAVVTDDEVSVFRPRLIRFLPGFHSDVAGFS